MPPCDQRNPRVPNVNHSSSSRVGAIERAMVRLRTIVEETLRRHKASLQLGTVEESLFRGCLEVVAANYLWASWASKSKDVTVTQDHICNVAVILALLRLCVKMVWIREDESQTRWGNFLHFCGKTAAIKCDCDPPSLTDVNLAEAVILNLTGCQGPRSLLKSFPL